MFGPGTDEPIVWYEGSGTTDRRFMSSDERGSIISLTDSSGTLLNINRYDEYGKPQSTNSGRFQYTGQKWIGEANLYDYKARDYVPHLGIFAQTDPIGYADSPNLYAYVLDDPLDNVDPLGMSWCDLLLPKEAQVLFSHCPGDPSPGVGHWDIWDPLHRTENTDRSNERQAGRDARSAKATKVKSTTKPKCGSSNDGPVNFRIDEFTTVPGGGIALAKGVFTTASGGRGTFESSGFAIGFELGASRRWGRAENLGTFTGTSDSFGGGIPFGGLSFSISRSQSSGAWYGSIGFGASAPPISGSVSTTDTNITSLTCPRG